MSAQFGTATEGRAFARCDVADVSAKPSRAALGMCVVRVVLVPGFRGDGREVWCVSVDDEVAGLIEIELAGLGVDWFGVGWIGVDWVEGVKGHVFMGSDEVWPGSKLVSGKSSLG